jgi:antitoxin (DNA-binding transcriptional repressor) of toxin-antitoxin stability system
MVTIAVEQFQKNPLDALRRVEAGETLLILRNNAPVAELKPAADLRPIGLCQHELIVPDDIADPLPPEDLKEFEGT